MTTPCPRDHAALTSAFCPDCGAARPEAPAEMTADERLAMLAESLENLHVDTWAPVLEPDEWGGKMVWDCANERGQAAALEFLAKARELLAVEPVALEGVKHAYEGAVAGLRDDLAAITELQSETMEQVRANAQAARELAELRGLAPKVGYTVQGGRLAEYERLGMLLGITGMAGDEGKGAP